MGTSQTFFDLPLPDLHQTQIVWGQLYGAAQSLAIAELARRQPQTLLVLTDSAQRADQLVRELRFFEPNRPTRRFCDYETLPYDAFSAPQELLADRLATLHALAQGETGIVVVNAQALLNRLPPVGFVESRSLELNVGRKLDTQQLRDTLVTHGYLHVEQVMEPGEFAVRGSLLDIFAAGAPAPVRIDLFDDEIEALRQFDPQTQRTTGKLDELRLLPAREFPFDAAAIREFRQRFRLRIPGDPQRAGIYREISEARLPAGIEYYLPLFFDDTATLLDYLPAECLCVLVGDSLAALDETWALIGERHEQLCGDAERPILGPSEAFWSPDALRARIESLRRLRLEARELEDAAPPGAFNAGSSHPLGAADPAHGDPIARWLDAAPGGRTLIVASSRGRQETVRDFLAGRGLRPAVAPDWTGFLQGDANLAIAIGELDDGMVLPEAKLKIVTAERLGLEKPRQRRRRRRAERDPDAIVRELTDLRIGAPVVHEEYGIGRYQGLSTLEVDGVTTEYLMLEYADGDKLYVPVYSLHLVTRYTGAAPDSAPLHRLGSDQWLKAKRKAAERARDVAAELLEVYARRAARKGNVYAWPDDAYQRFAMEFPFQETPDQQAAVQDVLADLASERPTDRVICGDVGFGKTEVALRAAFVAVEAGFQVAVLVPTTLLAQQHYRTFTDRFADWPVNVDLLSRFRSGKSSKAILDALASGGVDIVIGTHKLLGPDVRFKNLGLAIIDEEHRFGVRDKERLKRLRANVDVLTMTATPIPRTLNLALGGLRDLSLIATPPEARLAVKTFVGEWRPQGIREAVLREIRRGGQVYFVHNRVQDIDAIAEKLAELLPETEIRVAHGQMSERELESVMLDFYHRRFSVLVCSTIIESGIDVPSANTIIINRADKLGLAQLHQLRGRVGRSHHQAYAYLIAPPVRALTVDAAKRLEAIEALEHLGSGFTLASHDLEIRGAGELLGEEQSGQIQAIGFTLYNDLLARAVDSLRRGEEPQLEDPLEHGPQIELGLPALIPTDYMPDVHMRLVHYKRIASATTFDELRGLQAELVDRFGLLPPPTRVLFELAGLKLMALSIGVTKLQAGDRGGALSFGTHANVDPLKLVRLIDEKAGSYRLDGPFKLRFGWQAESADSRIEAASKLFRRLGAIDERGAAEADAA
jgi:transcription-repair coupling factor (superfamily II helicase)